MELHGQQIIAGKPSAQGTDTFTGKNPSAGPLHPPFLEATFSELDAAARAAASAVEELRRVEGKQRADFLDSIAAEIMALGEPLLKRAQAETALPEPRLTGERARTVAQLKMFAALLREGSWAEAVIDQAQPDRKPAPRPDLRRRLAGIGPVAVFGASNFPLAFSVAGGDTASALAAGNPVIVKAHPAHPGTSEMVARAIVMASEKNRMPAGIFSLLHSPKPDLALQLVRHPLIRAVGFTGSLQAGRALFNAAASRPEPIPVYAEMGSTNPVFILPGAATAHGPAIAEGLLQSVTLGVGQFCTNPGLAFGVKGGAFDKLLETASAAAEKAAPGYMLYDALGEKFRHGCEALRKVPGVKVAGQASARSAAGQAGAMVFIAEGKTFLQSTELTQEVFGPSTVLVQCDSLEEMKEIARGLPGNLTATIHGTPEELAANSDLIQILEQKAGRLLFNGFPTGVEVVPAMHHGGPYPAATDPHYTSVGTGAIKRFARPICYQNFPDAALPPELKNANPLGIWRLVDGQWTRDPV